MILQQIRIPQKIVLPFLRIVPIQTKSVQFKSPISAQGAQSFSSVNFVLSVFLEIYPAIVVDERICNKG